MTVASMTKNSAIGSGISAMCCSWMPTW